MIGPWALVDEHLTISNSVFPKSESLFGLLIV